MYETGQNWEPDRSTHGEQQQIAESHSEVLGEGTMACLYLEPCSESPWEI